MTTPRTGGPRRGALALLASTQLLLIMDTAIVNVALLSVRLHLPEPARSPEDAALSERR
ncbi:hypothetical protein [Streptomyces exfoliatus]|uniref:hypothetical protein n=1 Tax=Streptomyces exfoliatus TaxID=1905 RepID=UPI0004B93BA5|nr:hypothetical protein [Streptomyces exfoliatus]